MIQYSNIHNNIALLCNAVKFFVMTLLRNNMKSFVITEVCNNITK